MSLFVPDRIINEPKISFKVVDKVYRVLTPQGEVIGPIPDLPQEQLVDFYRWMLLGRAYSDQMVALQRQGKMGTFAAHTGQEATNVGIAAPLKPDDWLVASYRENLSHMIKGAPMLALMKQWGGHIADNYPRQINAPPFQVVLSTQTLHAVGIAQAIKYNKEPHVVVTACGDGATSEGDFNEALNFAGVFKAPIIFVIQNNGWAISTPRHKQSAAEYIADRGPGFGIASSIVDGNDVLAMYQVVSQAIARARAGEGPTLIEAITYRMGAHTTADDPTKYRSEAELEEWTRRDPITRFRTFLLEQNMLTEAADKQLYNEVNAQVQAVVDEYEKLSPPTPNDQFKHVYADAPPQLRRQQATILQDLGLPTSNTNGSRP